MNNRDFFKGIGMGIGIGAAISMAFAPVRSHKRAEIKSGVGKVVQSVGDIVEGVTDAVGL